MTEMAQNQGQFFFLKDNFFLNAYALWVVSGRSKIQSNPRFMKSAKQKGYL